MEHINTIHSFIKSHIAEISLLTIALSITIFSALPYQQRETILEESEVLAAVDEIEKKPDNILTNITVDVSGAVIKPDVYEVTEGARLADVIDDAGGLDKEADSGFIARNFNMARFLTDQEKIYIPFKKDIANGLFTEAPQVLSYLTSGEQSGTNTQQPTSDSESLSSLLISINTATTDELDMLPGVGPTTAQKIIDSRPYATIEELISKKAVKQSVFDDIKELISL